MSQDIQSMLKEKRVFKPKAAFAKKALVSSEKEYLKLYHRSLNKPEKFWAEMAEGLQWIKKWRKVVNWKVPFSEWFVGGKLNVSANCLDRHVASGRRNKAAIIWEGEPGEVITLTYQQLLVQVCKFANVLKAEGIKPGDRVAIYLPMIPEAVVAMLACTRIGAVHTVVFGGFSAEALKERINDCQAKLVVTADGGFRRGSASGLKGSVDTAVQGTPTVTRVIVVRRTGQEVSMGPLDRWYHELMAAASPDCPPAVLDSEHPLFILYTSGSTGKPKGILHTTAGYLLGCFLTTKYVFDLKEDDIFWCTADIGWITGHSYVVYGCLSNGGTSLLYEGTPNHPQPDRFWDIIARHKVNIFYTAPTAIRAFMKWGDEWPAKHDLSSLRLLGSVGEPINPEAWMWYHKVIGKGNCPIVDTWWQTETGCHMITTLPGANPTKPGSAGVPFFGIDVAVVDETGKEVPPDHGGKLVIRRPWPSMLRTIYGDASRYRKQYWSEVKGCYFTGDGARRDKQGYFWIVGRIDDVLNVSGHRLGTAEVESALVSHPAVAEAAVVGRPDDLKGQAVVAFVILKTGQTASDALMAELRTHVAKEIGPIAKPDDIRFAEALPKTRSGKIMRRLLKEVAAGGEVKGDVTTLEDLNVIAALQKLDE
ncbi:MAG: acetate--CoA ligase [Candidatus Methylacidiphilales bacterium]|nr:acetate--CoA ligase [Candidatus Methylacidiphilales bacterium]